MDQKMLSDYSTVIKHQIAAQESLFEYHTQIEAMIEMILAKDLIDYPKPKLHDYLCIVSNLVGEAKGINEDIINRLHKIIPKVDLLP